MKLFTIMLGVEPEAVGATLALLKKTRGVLKIDLDLERNQRTAKSKPNGGAPAKKFAQSAEDFILNLLAGGVPIPTKVVRDHFADAGRKPGSASSALNVLKSDGLIKHNDDKAWVLTKKAKDRLRWRATAQRQRDKRR